MAIAFVQANQGASSGFAATTTIVTAAAGSNSTTGNLLVAVVSWDDAGTPNCSGVTDGTNVFTQVEAKFTDANSQDIQLWYAKNITGKTTPVYTATFSVSTDFRRIVVFEFSGADTTAPLDKITHGQDTTRSPTTASVTTTTNGQVVVAGIMNDGGTVTETFAPGSGYIEPANGTAAAADNEVQAEYQIQTSAGGIAASWTRSNVSGTPHNIWALATFKASSPVGIPNKINQTNFTIKRASYY